MTKALVFFVLLSACVTVNAQSQAINKTEKPISLPFQEIIVSSDFKVRRKSKENRQGKELFLANVPSATATSPPGKSTALASRLVLSGGSSVTPDRRRKRHTSTAHRRLPKEGIAKYSLRSRQR
ncbi:uncharacterized protein LOC131668421 [Phymastichus coffea]|uniref:uncharacterized protein LOC131668421 n=1 Tax=Phymastichus coffea TaxID=108790 RepID=UPI00273C84F3|nr:uncharacterized protein LOC131668421 [Phymastichus coffea]